MTPKEEYMKIEDIGKKNREIISTWVEEIVEEEKLNEEQELMCLQQALFNLKTAFNILTRLDYDLTEEITLKRRIEGLEEDCIEMNKVIEEEEKKYE